MYVIVIKKIKNYEIYSFIGKKLFFYGIIM